MTKQKTKDVINKNLESVYKKISKISKDMDEIEKLRTLIFTKELVHKMIQLSIESIEKNIELGFALIKTIETDNIQSKGSCIGDCYGIMPSEYRKIKIKNHETLIGSFHTHKDRKPLASIHDLRSAYLYGFECIGGVINNTLTIKCYRRKTLFEESILDELDKLLIKEDLFFKTYDKIVDSMIIFPTTSELDKINLYEKIKDTTYYEFYNDIIRFAKEIHDESDKIVEQYFDLMTLA